MHGYLVVVFVISTYVVYGQDDNVVNVSSLTSAGQTADGRANFSYTAESTKEAAEKILFYQDNLEVHIVGYTDKLAQKGSTEDPEKLNSVITSCRNSIPANISKTLREEVKKHLITTQEIDNEMLVMNMACFSLRVPRSASCKAGIEKSEEKVANITSAEELVLLDSMSQDAIKNTENYLSDCVAKGV